MIQEAIDFYHDLLLDSEFAAEADHDLRHLLKERGLYFGQRPLCVSLRPHFYLAADWDYIRTGLETLLTAFRKVHEVCWSDAEQRQKLMLHPWEEELLHLDEGIPVAWSSSRLDNFFVADTRSLMTVEYNAETPAGIGYGDKLEEVFMRLKPIHRFKERYHVRSMPALGNLTDALLRAWKAWGGTEMPQIAILDWRDVPTLSEHEISRVFFAERGITARLIDPRELEFTNGHLSAGDFRIDMVYKRVLFSELVDTLGKDNPMVKAMRAKAVLVSNSVSAKLLAKKASLAFLSDETHAALFTPAQRAAIDAHIPWTRVVRDGKATYQGQPIDLLPFIAANKDNLVLKPNDEYGGRGVVIGWESSGDAWESALTQAVETPHVVQERVATVTRPFPAWIDDRLEISPLFVDADPYVFYGEQVHGCLTRLSPMALLNVTAGMGSIVPTLLIEKKD